MVLPPKPGGHLQKKLSMLSTQVPLPQGFDLQSLMSSWQNSPSNPLGHKHRYSPRPGGYLILVTHVPPLRQLQGFTPTWGRQKGIVVTPLNNHSWEVYCYPLGRERFVLQTCYPVLWKLISNQFPLSR